MAVNREYLPNKKGISYLVTFPFIQLQIDLPGLQFLQYLFIRNFDPGSLGLNDHKFLIDSPLGRVEVMRLLLFHILLGHFIFCKFFRHFATSILFNVNKNLLSPIYVFSYFKFSLINLIGYKAIKFI